MAETKKKTTKKAPKKAKAKVLEVASDLVVDPVVYEEGNEVLEARLRLLKDKRVRLADFINGLDKVGRKDKRFYENSVNETDKRIHEIERLLK